jgi:excisionase family DNA binding protein
VLLTYPETARALTISRRTLERMVSGGTFPQPLRVGGSSRFHRDDVANYLEQLRRARGEKLGTS